MKSNSFPSHLGFVEDTVPDDIFDILVSNAYRAKKEGISAAHNLVGQLEESYDMLNMPFYEYVQIEKYLLNVCSGYENEFSLMTLYPVIAGNLNLSLELKMLWVNFQKKYEFNPVHHHTGLYSFVIWVKIPYDYKTECSIDSCKNAKAKLPGSFAFYYTDHNGRIEEAPINLDPSYEKKIVVFPSYLSHCVYPFYTSDDYRISISGNLYLNFDPQRQF